MKMSSNMKGFVVKDPLSLKLIKAETRFSYFIAEHNVPFSVASHFNKLVKSLFPDSEIAKNYKCWSYKKQPKLLKTQLQKT